MRRSISAELTTTVNDGSALVVAFRRLLVDPRECGLRWIYHAGGWKGEVGDVEFLKETEQPPALRLIRVQREVDAAR